ncbi:hypothetical protein BMF89_21245 [Arthrobacter sp. SRS-W-1-2016]|nr:hypothetical protein BMF89_21245 [Arthrobacter sp. SRS-W-1-2016]
MADVVPGRKRDPGDQLRIFRIHVVRRPSGGAHGQPVLRNVPFIILLPIDLQVGHGPGDGVDGGGPDVQVPERTLLQHHTGQEAQLAVVPELVSPHVPRAALGIVTLDAAVHCQVGDGIEQIEGRLRLARIQLTEDSPGDIVDLRELLG